MRSGGAAFEFGVELAGDEIGVAGDFYHFGEAAVGAGAAEC